jgi:methyl-accepting chemotaxis protein
MEHSVEIANEPSSASVKIMEVLDVMQNIAEHMNLLVANATIEAVRASEQGSKVEGLLLLTTKYGR